MKFFDMHVHSTFSEGESTVMQFADMAKQLGYSGICFSEFYEGRAHFEKIKAEAAKAEQKSGIRIMLGLEAGNLKELRRLVDMRHMFDVLLVHGGDLRMNRAAVEAKEVDILTHPYRNRYDSGMNHVMAKLAKRNSVAVEINFNEILESTKKTRSHVLSNTRDIIDLARRYGMKLMLCSGAKRHWDMRDPIVMYSMAQQLGMKLNDAKAAVSRVPEAIIKDLDKRKSDNWVIPGVIKR
jgi:ribonuclease P/MRP protein subunit RPP1